MFQNSHLITKKNRDKHSKNCFQNIPKGHFRGLVHGDVTHAPSESFWKFHFLIIFTDSSILT